MAPEPFEQPDFQFVSVSLVKYPFPTPIRFLFKLLVNYCPLVYSDLHSLKHSTIHCARVTPFDGTANSISISSNVQSDASSLKSIPREENECARICLLPFNWPNGLCTNRSKICKVIPFINCPSFCFIFSILNFIQLIVQPLLGHQQKSLVFLVSQDGSRTQVCGISFSSFNVCCRSS